MSGLIRSERVSDIAAIARFQSQLYGGEAEAEFVQTCRDQGQLLFSLLLESECVASEGVETDSVEVAEKSMDGHLAVLPSVLVTPKRTVQCMALAPLCVRDNAQVYFSQLLSFWLENYADAFYQAVFVVAEHKYYQSFGFQLASASGIKLHPDSYAAEQIGLKPSLDLLVCELKKGFLSKNSGELDWLGPISPAL